MLQERDSYRSLLDTYEKDLTVTSSGMLNSQQQQQRSRIDALEKTVEGYRELVERLEGDLEKTMKGSGNYRPQYSSGNYIHHYSLGEHFITGQVITCVTTVQVIT
jgi:hypothetical protein